MFFRFTTFFITAMLLVACSSDANESGETDTDSETDSDTGTVNSASSTDSTTGTDAAPNTYDLPITWAANGLENCRYSLADSQSSVNELIIDSVEFNFYQDKTKQTVIQAPISVPCSEKEAIVTLPLDVPCFVTANVYANFGEERLRSFQGEKEVNLPEDESGITVLLQPVDGEIQTFWQFAGGLVCGIAMAGEVKNVAITLNDRAPFITPCGNSQLKLGNIPPGTAYRIHAEALDAEGNVYYTADHIPQTNGNEFQLLPGQTYTASLLFE